MTPPYTASISAASGLLAADSSLNLRSIRGTHAWQNLFDDLHTNFSGIFQPSQLPVNHLVFAVVVVYNHTLSFGYFHYSW